MGDLESAKILHERAVRLARPVARATAPNEIRPVLMFGLGPETYAVDTSCVRAVHTLKSCTRVPCTPEFVLGIVGIRGEIVSVLDLRRFFDLPAAGLTNLNKVIVIESGAMRLGILADNVLGIVDLLVHDIHEPPASFQDKRAEYVAGVTGNATIVLDVPRLLADSGIIVDEGQ